MNPISEVHDFIKEDCGVYHIATVEGNQPHVRPFSTILIFEGKLYIQTGKVKDVYRQIKANPAVEIEAFDGKTDWVRITATLVEDDRAEPAAAMLEAYPELKAKYAPGDGNCVTFYLQDATASFSSFVKEPHTVTF